MFGAWRKGSCNHVKESAPVCSKAQAMQESQRRRVAFSASVPDALGNGITHREDGNRLAAAEVSIGARVVMGRLT